MAHACDNGAAAHTRNSSSSDKVVRISFLSPNLFYLLKMRPEAKGSMLHILSHGIRAFSTSVDCIYLPPLMASLSSSGAAAVNLAQGHSVTEKLGKAIMHCGKCKLALQCAEPVSRATSPAL